MAGQPAVPALELLELGKGLLRDGSGLVLVLVWVLTVVALLLVGAAGDLASCQIRRLTITISKNTMPIIMVSSRRVRWWASRASCDGPVKLDGRGGKDGDSCAFRGSESGLGGTVSGAGVSAGAVGFSG